MQLGHRVYRFCARYIIPGVLSLALLLTLVTVSWDAKVAVDAQLANYFASTCTGGWQNPEAASGRPDVSGEGYTPDNAAVFLDNAAEIECLGFTGELPPLTYHTEASIRFSWSQPGRVTASVEDVVLDELPEGIETATSTTAVENNGGTDSAPSSTTESATTTNDGVVADDAVVSTTTATEELDSTVPITTEEDATESTATETIVESTNPETEVVVPSVQSEAVAEPPAAVPAEAEVVSWLHWLLPVALAEEVVPESTPIDTVVTPQDEDEVVVDDTVTLDTLPIEVVEATTSLASSTATNTEPVYATPTTTSTAATPQFAVFFKVKDNPWIRLGEIITIHNDIRLPLPKAIVTEISSFADVSVRLEALPQFDDVPPVYLDALWIEVDYAPLDALGVHTISPLVPTTYTIADIILPVSTTSSSSLSAIPTEQATSSVLLPRLVTDFAASLRWVQGIDGRFVLAEIVEGTSTELWLFDIPALTITRIGFAEGGLGSIRPIVKDGLIFWQNTTGNKIFTFDTRIAGQLYEYLLVSNLPEADEYLFTFPYTSWNVIWRGSQFFMFHSDTGEVFGDSDGRSLDAFNRLFTLTSLLSPDQLDMLSITPSLSTNSDDAVAE